MSSLLAGIAVPFTLHLAFAFSAPSPAGEGASCCALDLNALSQKSCCELEALFRAGTAAAPPCGYGRGKTLLLLDRPRPKAGASRANAVWKGKHFLPCGRMINQWAGFRAVGADVRVEPSALDGKPCVLLDYPPDAPVFGGDFDEIREISPGLWIGRYSERCPCPHQKGWFALDFRCN